MYPSEPEILEYLESFLVYQEFFERCILHLFFPISFMKKDSWLYSDNFLKRAFAIWGYNAVAGAIIGLPIAIIAMLIGMTVARTIEMAP